jgi:hypothetical protein
MKRMNMPGSESQTEDWAERFRCASSALAAIGRQANYKLIPYHNSTLPLFSKLPADSQQQIVETLEKTHSVYAQVVDESQDVRNPASVVWAAFRTLHILPPSNFFDKLSSDDVIQIYTKDGYHLFANFRFFDLCSYTIEQIYSIPWPQLWHRDESALAGLQQAVSQCLASECNETLMLLDIPHRVCELASPFKYELSYSLKGIAPIWERKPYRKIGFITIEHGQILNSPSPAREEEMLREFYQNQAPAPEALL